MYSGNSLSNSCLVIRQSLNFLQHYDAIMRYVNKGPLFIDVHMHKPTVAARTYMDSLLAFWPGIQVLKGDLKAAIEFHETLYQVIKV